MKFLVPCCMLVAMAGGLSASAPRADGSVLHVDFEHYIDNGVGFLNAGVRWLGYPFTATKQKVVAVPENRQLAYGGSRCGYVFTDERTQRGRICLQRRVDNPNRADEVAEFVFRPVSEGAAQLNGFIVWSATQYQGGAVGISVVANGSVASAMYSLAIKDADGIHENVVGHLPQARWIRIILHRLRSRRMVAVWIGPPDQEKLMGEYKDFDANHELGRIELGDLSDSEVLGSGYWDDVRVGRPLGGSGKLFPPEPPADVRGEKAKSEGPILVGREKQLFVDDAVIQSQNRLKRNLHPAIKHPKNPLIVPDRPWEAKSLIQSGMVRKDPQVGRWRCWYTSWGVQVGKPSYVCLAESDDGIIWRKPNLGLYEFHGSKDNNILREGRLIGMWYDSNEKEPTKRYKATVRDGGALVTYSVDGVQWRGSEPPTRGAGGFWAAYSADGLQWRAGGQILEQAYDATTVCWDPTTKKWLASCKVWYQGRRARGFAESADYENWTDTRLSLTIDHDDSPSDQLYHMTITRYESVYIGPMKVYHTDSDRCEIQLAFSRNAKHWVRPDRTPFIANSAQKGAWDYGNMDQVGGWDVVGDEIWFYYGGRSTLHNESPNDGSIGLATLRLDGFMSMDGGADEGVLITQPLILKGKSLFINADAKGGIVKVEVIAGHPAGLASVGADEAVLPYTKAGCAAVARDSLRQEIHWAGTSGLESLQNKPVRLKFYLRNAKLYSFWAE